MERAENSQRAEWDRISGLPDSLIHLIMSFLTAQEAVQTCILSKRWKNIWTTLPYLDFDLSEFEYDDESDDIEWEYDDFRRHKFNKFREFVSTTLLLREALNLHNFRLSCHEMLDSDEYVRFMRSSILYALKHNIQVLSIHFKVDGSLPLGIFTCASLVDASLHFPISGSNIKVINLPCLRRLHLRWVELEQNFVDKLFCCCPVIEYLHLEDCYRACSTINSHNLKYLKVENCNASLLRENDSVSINELMLINTPNLLSYYYKNTMDEFRHKMLLKMASLTSADICIASAVYKWKNWCYKGKNIFIGLSNVQSLKLSGSGINEFIENELPNCPEFLNLKDLYVDDLCLSCHFNVLASFLDQFPDLEKLSLQWVGCHCKEKAHGNWKSMSFSLCNVERLQTVEVKCCKNDKYFPRVNEVYTELHPDINHSDQHN